MQKNREKRKKGNKNGDMSNLKYFSQNSDQKSTFTGVAAKPAYFEV